ncbi:MAG: twin-arginine translocase TatA/TatE family subunit [Armatimonadetes bacterium]|nr:twin-arginine translocase TatA/TatE family subunit [Armatimonadota bacterium]
MIYPTLAYWGTQEIVIVGVIALILFGGSKLPIFAKGIGEGIREFKKSLNGDDDTPPPAPTATTEAAK